MRNPDTLSNTQPAPPEDTPQGLAFAIGAYGLWGFLPLYMKAIAHIPAEEIVVHRVIWSVPVGALVLILLGRPPPCARRSGRRVPWRWAVSRRR